MTPKWVLKTFHGPTWIKTNKNTTENQYRLDYCRYIFGWNVKAELFLQYPTTIPALGAPCPRGGTSDFKWRGWLKGRKNQNPKKSLDQKINPQKIPNRISKPQSFPENWYNTKNTPKNPYLIKMPKKILAKFSQSKKSWKRKLQTQKYPSIISVIWSLDYLHGAPSTW